jgi:hypothetical protein
MGPSGRGLVARALARRQCAGGGRTPPVLAHRTTRGRALGIEQGRTGSVTVVQRLGSDLALNLHFHMLVLDGVYDAHGRFITIAAPSSEQMHQLCAHLAQRIARLLERRALAHDGDDEGKAVIAEGRDEPCVPAQRGEIPLLRADPSGQRRARSARAALASEASSSGIKSF